MFKLKDEHFNNLMNELSRITKNLEKWEEDENKQVGNLEEKEIISFNQPNETNIKSNKKVPFFVIQDNYNEMYPVTHELFQKNSSTSMN